MSTVKCLAYTMQNCMAQIAKGQPLMCCFYCPYTEGCEYKCANNPRQCGQSMVTMENVPVPVRKRRKGKQTRNHKVERLHPDTKEVLEEYNSAMIAAQQMKVSHTTMYGAINKETMCAGYWWRYKEE